MGTHHTPPWTISKAISHAYSVYISHITYTMSYIYYSYIYRASRWLIPAPFRIAMVTNYRFCNLSERGVKASSNHLTW